MIVIDVDLNTLKNIAKDKINTQKYFYKVVKDNDILKIHIYTIM